VKFLVAQEVDDELAAGEALLAELVARAQAARRSPCRLSTLRVGLKCGGSDGYSGITANPLVGAVSDLVNALGGACVLTEIPEAFGAEGPLLDRCTSRQVFDEAVGLFSGFKRRFLQAGHPIGENPSPGNRQGGITTLEEKSLGCTQKGGKAPLSAVLRYGERVRTAGLNLLEGPGNDIVAVTALAAAGCQLVLFTTGRGTPLGGPVPVVKIATHSSLARRKAAWIDLDAGRLLAGVELPALADEALRLCALVASGRRTASEAMGARDFSIWRGGVTL
jgi:altronate hydrolase